MSYSGQNLRNQTFRLDPSFVILSCKPKTNTVDIDPYLFTDKEAAVKWARNLASEQAYLQLKDTPLIINNFVLQTQLGEQRALTTDPVEIRHIEKQTDAAYSQLDQYIEEHIGFWDAQYQPLSELTETLKQLPIPKHAIYVAFPDTKTAFFAVYEVEKR